MNLTPLDHCYSTCSCDHRAEQTGNELIHMAAGLGYTVMPLRLRLRQATLRNIVLSIRRHHIE
jgi:hypothetical protein